MLFLVCTLYPITLALLFGAATVHYAPVEGLAWLRAAILLLFLPILGKYLAHLLVAPWYGLVERFRSKRARGLYAPPVSVLIPAWNEEVGVAATIRSVLATGYPDLEVVVINDGSTDRTHDIVHELLDDLRAEGHLGGSGWPAVHYRCVANGGKARALNMALAIARGEIVVTIDADSVMERDFLDRIVRPFRRPAMAAVAGSVVVGNRGRAIGVVQALEYLYGFYFKRADALLGAVYIVGGAAAAYRRQLLLDLGGFDETVITEDIELSTRLQHRGYTVGYAADAVVHTEGPSDLPGLCRQRLRWKYGRLLTFQKYRDLFFSRRPGHNRWLTFVVLPVAMFAEFLLLLEPVLLAIFYGYTLYTEDFAPLAVAVSALAAVVALQVAASPCVPGRGLLLALAPVAWLLFYWLDAIEFQALVRSVRRLTSGRGLHWQRWQRQGVFGEPTTGALRAATPR